MGYVDCCGYCNFRCLGVLFWMSWSLGGFFFASFEALLLGSGFGGGALRMMNEGVGE